MNFGLRKSLFFLLALAIFGSAVFYCKVFSYDTNAVHPFLTEKAISAFNKNSENKISNDEAK